MTEPIYPEYVDDQYIGHLTWSDLFSRTAEYLAVLYLARGAPAGQSVEQWLQDVARPSRDGITMLAQVEHFVAQRGRAVTR